MHYSLLWAYDGPVSCHALKGHYADTATSCWLIRKGSVVVKTGSQCLTGGPDDWVFVASPGRHQHFSPDIHILSLHFELYWPGGEPLINRKINRVCPSSLIPNLEKAALPLIKLLNRF